MSARATATHGPHFFPRIYFCVGKYAAYLDDIRDYLDDCNAGQWNTMSFAFYSRHSFPLVYTEQTKTRLIASLADDAFTDLMIQTGLALRRSIEERLLRLPGIDPDSLRPLLADLTYEYLG
jgi:hypothetical protein